MSAILYHLTVTDNKGKVLFETTHTSPVILVQELPQIRDIAEQQVLDEETRLSQMMPQEPIHDKN